MQKLIQSMRPTNVGRVKGQHNTNKYFNVSNCTVKNRQLTADSALRTGTRQWTYRYKLTKLYSSRGLPGKKFDYSWKRQAKNINYFTLSRSKELADQILLLFNNHTWILNQYTKYFYQSYQEEIQWYFDFRKSTLKPPKFSSNLYDKENKRLHVTTWFRKT